jgi:catalase
MIWHFLLVHDDYGNRVGKGIRVSASDLRNLQPLDGQALTAEDQRRLQKLGNNGDVVDPGKWGKWTRSVDDQQVTADQVLAGLREMAAAAK